MSLRAITHKLTEDRILTPNYAKKFQEQPPEDGEVRLGHCVWGFTTVREILMDLENIGTLVVCKAKQKIGPDGKRVVEVHPNRREVPGGIPVLVDVVTYKRALAKLKTNRADKSHLPLNPEDYLLRGHIFCAACHYSMKPRTQKKGRLTKKGTDKSYPFYRCTNMQNKCSACLSMTNIRISPLDEIVWQECYTLFQRIDTLRAVLQKEIEAAVSGMLEDTTGNEQIRTIEATIALAKSERDKHAKGSYTHALISEDITKQEEEQLARFKEEVRSVTFETALNSYQQRVMDFLEFLNVMQGRYEQATFQEKHNAIEALGVRVVVHEPVEAYGLREENAAIGEGQEWFSAGEAAAVLGIASKTIHRYRNTGIIANYKEAPHLLVHRDELLKLQERGFVQRNTREIVRSRIDISYSPQFVVEGNNLTSVPASL